MSEPSSTTKTVSIPLRVKRTESEDGDVTKGRVYISYGVRIGDREPDGHIFVRHSPIEIVNGMPLYVGYEPGSARVVHGNSAYRAYDDIEISTLELIEGTPCYVAIVRGTRFLVHGTDERPIGDHSKIPQPGL